MIVTLPRPQRVTNKTHDLSSSNVSILFLNNGEHFVLMKVEQC